MIHSPILKASVPFIPNQWIRSGNWWTLIRCMPDAVNIHCYGSGETKKQAARMWVADWWRKRAFMENVRRNAA